MSKICLMCGDTFPDASTFCPKDGSALRAAVHGDDLIGEVFCDRYVVTDLLGEGGMGAVYVARDVRLPQQVAIKVLRDKTTVDPVAVSRFRQEAEAASRINHDRVARVSDFGFMNDGRAYIIMEYVSGRTLKQTIEDRGPLSATESASIATMVAEGLDAAHRIGIVHRDLKPENVMIVDDAGGGTRVKVLDFGIAKVLQGDESAGRTAPGFVIGTPQWMSPEQILGDTLDARSDVFALGLLAYAMLTAQRAFAGTSEQAEMMARLTSPPRPLEEALPGVMWPSGLQALLNRTLSRDVNLRPSTALAFAREFTQLVDAVRTITPVQTTPVVVPSVVAAAPARNGLRIGIGAGVVVAAVAVVALVLRPWEKQPANTSATTPSSDSVRSTVPVAPTGAGVNAPTSTDLTGAAAPASAPARVTAQSPSVTPTTPVSTPGKPVASVAASPPRTPVPANTKTSDGKNVVVNSGTPKTSDATKPPATDPSQAASAPDELQRIMHDADSDIGDEDNNSRRAKAREIIRRLETLSSRLTGATDQGWAQFYVGTSQATLGDNDKACSAINRAHTLASQSAALRNSSEQWQKNLNCH